MKLIKQRFNHSGSFWLPWKTLLFSRRPFELKTSEKKTPITFLLFHFQSVIFMLRIDVIMYGNVVVPNNDSNIEDIYKYLYVPFTFMLTLQPIT